MSSTAAKKFYAIASGRQTGVFTTWEECRIHVEGYRGAVFKSFTSLTEAEKFVASRGTSIATNNMSGYGTSALAKGKLFNACASRSSAKGTLPTNPIAAPKPNEKKRAREKCEAHDESDLPSAKKRKLRRFALDESVYASCANVLHVYTDGSFKKQFAGAGAFFGHGDERNIAEPMPGALQTSQRAELYAIVRTLETIAAAYRDNDAPEAATVIIHTDSKYAVGTISKGWQRNCNHDLLDRIDTLMGACHRHTILFDQVPAHSGIDGNEQADRLANIGADKNLADHLKHNNLK